MSVLDIDTAEVREIPPQMALPWLLQKHYARRKPSIVHAFGLFCNDNLCGVCTFGVPPNNALNTIGGFAGIELNRLVINESAPKNAASFLVAGSLRRLPQPLVVVSYADGTHGHIGYVYQATNWLYTGFVRGDTEFRKDGRTYHRKALFNRYKTGAIKALVERGYEPVKQGGKHRYVFLCGTKGQKKLMKTNLPWTVQEYPKGTPQRYDSGVDL